MRSDARTPPPICRPQFRSGLNGSFLAACADRRTSAARPLSREVDDGRSSSPDRPVGAESEGREIVGVELTAARALRTLAGASAASDGLIGVLPGEQSELGEHISAAVRRNVAVYRLIPIESLDFEVGVIVRQVLATAGARREVLSDGEQADVAKVGEQRASQSIPVDDVLRAWRIAVEAAIDYVCEVARLKDAGESQLLEFVRHVLRWSDLALVAMTRVYRRAELAVEDAADERHAEFVRGTLLGTVPSAELRMKAEVYGLDPGGDYVAMRARLDRDMSQRQLEKAVGFHDPQRGPRGLCAFVDGEIIGFMTEAPPGDLDGIIGFGPPRPLERLSESYRLAARALVTAQACGLQGAYDIASLGLRPAVAMDADVGEALRRRYLQPLAAANSAAELMATLRSYLACGMHVERTATRLFVHQNTVRYRIARFEELTGASLGDIEVLLEVWWALELSAMRL